MRAKYQIISHNITLIICIFLGGNFSRRAGITFVAHPNLSHSMKNEINKIESQF